VHGGVHMMKIPVVMICFWMTMEEGEGKQAQHGPQEKDGPFPRGLRG
jgi:hypothetical protein